MHTYNKIYIGDNTSSFKINIGQFAMDYKIMPEANNVYLHANSLSLKELIKLCLNAKEVIYCPPTKWSSDDLKYLTIGVTEYLTTIREVKQLRANLYGLGPIPYESRAFGIPSFLHVVEPRKSEDTQIWMIGCSFTNGHGLDNKDKRFGQLFADELELPVSFLTMNGASNQWSADQILKSDIRKDDIVFWGITGVARSTIYTEERAWPITINMLDKNSSLYKRFIIDNNKIAPMRRMITEEFLLSNHSLYETINHIAQVRNFLDKIGCKFLIGYFADLDSPYYHHMGQMINYITSQKDEKLFIFSPEYPWEDIITRAPSDTNNDDTPVNHPGPQQHKKYFADIKDLYNKIYK